MRLRRSNPPREPLPDSVWGPEIAALMQRPQPWSERRIVTAFIGGVANSIVPGVAFALALFREGLDLPLRYAWPLGMVCGITVMTIAFWMEMKGWIEIDGGSGD